MQISIAMETTPKIPNAVFPTQIIIQSGIHSGEMKTAVTAMLQAQKLNVDKSWEEAYGRGAVIQVHDILKLDSDIAPLQKRLQNAVQELAEIIGEINKVRKTI